MKERVFAAVREMKREQWLICGLAGLLLLVIAAPVKKKEAVDKFLEKNPNTYLRLLCRIFSK